MKNLPLFLIPFDPSLLHRRNPSVAVSVSVSVAVFGLNSSLRTLAFP
jgi:hypothetical protein